MHGIFLASPLQGQVKLLGLGKVLRSEVTWKGSTHPLTGSPAPLRANMLIRPVPRKPEEEGGRRPPLGTPTHEI